MMSYENEGFDELVAIVEIPAGSDLKTELNEASGKLENARPLHDGLRYPVNYGLIPGTLAGDGDPIDVLVLTRAPLETGTVMTVRPVALLNMQDTGKDDPKVVAIPTTATAAAGGSGGFSDDMRHRIEEFFRHYKDDPETGRSAVQVAGWKDADAARQAISRSVAAFAQHDFLERSLQAHDR